MTGFIDGRSRMAQFGVRGTISCVTAKVEEGRNFVLRANAIEHHVQDFDGEVQFFREILGCPENMYVPNTVGSFKVADNLTVLVLPRDEAHPPYTNLKGITIDISVDLPDVDALYKKLKNKGVAIRQAPINQPMGVRTFYFETPGGLTIEYEAPKTKDGAQLLEKLFAHT